MFVLFNCNNNTSCDVLYLNLKILPGSFVFLFSHLCLKCLNSTYVCVWTHCVFVCTCSLLIWGADRSSGPNRRRTWLSSCLCPLTEPVNTPWLFSGALWIHPGHDTHRFVRGKFTLQTSCAINNRHYVVEHSIYTTRLTMWEEIHSLLSSATLQCRNDGRTPSSSAQWCRSPRSLPVNK